jgi:hypothetical protein
MPAWPAQRKTEGSMNITSVTALALGIMGHHGEQRLTEHDLDGQVSICSACNAAVLLEWDDGVKLDTPKSLADEAIERARRK